ncbi:MAG TPA: VWA domain-containing protein, partial [Terriglobales bacterium]|nr:VWA domain-containing protein [Terriglobales bacterium]
FQVFDERHPQEIKLFEEIKTSAQTPQTSIHSSKDEFNNYVNTKSDEPQRLTIIVFDLINMPTLKQSSAKKALLDFLADAASTSEPTAVYSISQKGVSVISDFTTSPKVLAQALQSLKFGTQMKVAGVEPTEHEWLMGGSRSAVGPDLMSNVQMGVSDEMKGATIRYALEQFTSQLQLNMSSMERRYTVTYTLEGMHQIAQACAAIPGRKALLWITGGFPFDINPTDMMLYPADQPTYPSARSGLEEVRPLYSRLWRDLNDAQVSVYPIDVRGMVNPTLMDPSIRNTGGIDPGSRYERSLLTQHRQTIDTDQTFAHATGGKPFYGSNDLKAAFVNATRDSSSYYLIGYYIKPENATKIQWHSIEVKSPRKGIEIRARGGYFYRPNNADLQQNRQQDLSAGLLSPIDFTAIPLMIRWKQFPSGHSEAQKVGFEVVMPANFAEINEADSNHLISDIIVQPKKLDGTPVGQPLSRTMDAHLNPTQVQQLKEHGLTYVSSLELPKGEYAVRFVVRDGLNGHMGSVTALLKIE